MTVTSPTDDRDWSICGHGNCHTFLVTQAARPTRHTVSEVRATLAVFRLQAGSSLHPHFSLSLVFVSPIHPQTPEQEYYLGQAPVFLYQEVLISYTSFSCKIAQGDRSRVLRLRAGIRCQARSQRSRRWPGHSLSVDAGLRRAFLVVFMIRQHSAREAQIVIFLVYLFLRLCNKSPDLSTADSIQALKPRK